MNVNEALQLLKNKGYKLTVQRKQMLKVFANNNKYINARSVLKKMESNYTRISFDTVYRNLTLFVELGILEMTELSGEKYFRYTCSNDEHHHHFICLQCGKTKQIETCPMKNISEDLSNYAIEDHKFEIYGRCPQCIV